MKKFFNRFFVCVLSILIVLSTLLTVSADVTDSATSNSVIDNSQASDYDKYLNAYDYPVATKDIDVKINKTLSENNITFEITVPQTAFYKFGLNYKALGNQTSDLVFGLKIDGKYPFSDAKKLNLFRMYTNHKDGNRIDGLGNEFTPKQVPYENFYFDNVSDITRWTNEDYLFALTKGTHKISLVKVDGSFEIKNVVLSGVYDLNEYDNAVDESKFYNGEPIIIEGESSVLKSSNTLAGLSDNSTLDISPNDTYKILVNYIGGSNWKKSGQTLVWETGEVEEGYYNLGFSFRQSALLGAKVYRSLKIDGKTPFKEADAIGFKYSYKWQHTFFADKDKNPYLIYLSKGNHTISLEVTSGEITTVRNLLKDTVAKLSDLYVDITMITGESVDVYRDYDLFAQIPEMESTLKDISKNLTTSSESLQEITGEKSGSYISIINNMRQIVDLMSNNRYTAHRYKDEYYSKYTSLASILFEMTDMPLDIDKISLVSPQTKMPFEKSGIFKKFGFSVEKFLNSFVQEYNSISGFKEDGESITLWVNWGRDQAQVLNSLIKSEYTSKTGINVDVQMVNASVVQAVLSGKGPDVLLQQSRSEPVNLAMRGMLYDLKKFDDYTEVLKNFQDGAELPYYYKNGLYALPDTQSFYLMFYRTDILEEMGLTVPRTWDEFNEVAKILTRNNLTVWMPNNTATSTTQANIGIGSINLFPTLLVQKGLEVYKEDGKSTNLSDSAVIKTFREWTDLYSKLKLPRTMDFYNRFRTGTCPLGVYTYTLYTTLKAAAPEIDGMWDVALVPGTVDEKGKLNQASTGGGTACAILDLPTTNVKNAWSFLKWWVSKDTQLNFSSEIESILGPTGRVSISNIEAFESLEWDAEMKDTIVTAMNQAEEIPEYPGSYYVSRSVYQAFWNVVENNQNAKQTLLKFAVEADEEIERKWKQYDNR